MDGSSTSRPPQPSPKGQQGVSEIIVTHEEMAVEMQSAVGSAKYDLSFLSIWRTKATAALAERDARIAELEAENAALKKRASGGVEVTEHGDLVEVPAEANIYREEFPGLKDAKPARQKRGEG